MLSNKDPIATVAVSDLEAARRFYERKVGLTPAPGEQEASAVSYKTGSSSLLVYQSEYAGSNKATTVTWMVGPEVDQTVRELKAKGVAFEHYDMPDAKLEGDVHVMGAMRAAWFKDPDGNIHALVSG